jgi:hypothetical protein
VIAAAVIAAAALLAGCGGGSAKPELDLVPQSAIGVRPKAAELLPDTSVAPDEAARQLMDFAEATFPSLFPGHPATGSSPPFAYRAYPGGVYLGVVVGEASPYSQGGVYAAGILGGTLADPAYAGQLTDFIAPVAPGATSNDCFDFELADTAGTHIVVGYGYSGTVTGNETVDTTVGALTTFEGFAARQTTVSTSGTHTAAGRSTAVNTYWTAYQSAEADIGLTQYGLKSSATVFDPCCGGDVTITTTNKTVFSPPYVDPQYSLALGQSRTATLSGTLTTTIRRNFGGDQVSTTPLTAVSTTTTYAGQEWITVPAGTYKACKFQVIASNADAVTTHWVIAGKGITVKTVVSGSADQTIEAKSVLLNGVGL